jgi:hypothetical protein
VNVMAANHKARRREERIPWLLVAIVVAGTLGLCWLAFYGPGT